MFPEFHITHGAQVACHGVFSILVLCASVNVCGWSLRSGAFLEHHDSSFLEVDRQGPGLTEILQQIQGCPEAPLQ